MRETTPQVGRALRPPRERITISNQVAGAARNATDVNAKTNILHENHETRKSNVERANSHWKVVVWECQTSRLRLIDGVVSDCGAHTYRVEDWDDIEKAPCSSCCAAVVALGPYQTDETLASKVIGRLKQAGLTVIAHERGAHTWSVGLRCRILLAGASCVLDSDESGFSHELRRIMTEVMTHKMCQSAEKERIHGLMRTFGIVGESDAIAAAFRQALRVGPFSDLAVLITGESGTGKELMARAIHQLDPKRRAGPFIAVNCGAISSGLAMSEIFGHSRGAFTGADRDRKGLIRAADGGVLFLDEIGELGSDIQAMLLRVLQDHRVLSVGTEHDVGADVRVIAATNRNLEFLMERGQFRGDLFHRLNMLGVHLPPLRERAADLKPLIDNFLDKYRSTAASATFAVDRDFIAALAQLELPGNVRQLENIVRRAVLNKIDDRPLGLSDFSPEIWRQLYTQGQTSRASADADCRENPATNPRASCSPAECIEPLLTKMESKEWNLSGAVKHCELLLIEAALQRAQGNHSQAARVLGVTPRTLYNKLKKPHRDSDA
jgi:transcriptional regulator with GAF, ATPase, and Fis domain